MADLMSRGIWTYAGFIRLELDEAGGEGTIDSREALERAVNEWFTNHPSGSCPTIEVTRAYWDELMAIRKLAPL